MLNSPRVKNALSVDVEEYYHGMEFEAAVPDGEREQLPSRVEHNVMRVLEIFASHAVRATFFIVGKVAEAHPQMVRDIATAGHEVACHSYRHELVSRQTAEEFRNDVHRAKSVLEALTGHRVIGYRAPNYSIGSKQNWAYDILLEEEFLYDSSIYPILHDRYGQMNAPRFPYPLRVKNDRVLVEFPIGTARVCGMNVPIGGGGYFRLFPESWIRRGIQWVNVREKQGVMFYFHPWELDPDQPRPPMPWAHRFRHYVNLRHFAHKLEVLVEHVRFVPACESLQLCEYMSRG